MECKAKCIEYYDKCNHLYYDKCNHNNIFYVNSIYLQYVVCIECI